MQPSVDRKDPARWENRYVTGDIPWNREDHDPYLEKVIKQYAIAPQAMLEIGCGTGTNALWLCQQGFTVTGTDVSTTAIEKARQKAKEQQVSCDFVVQNIFTAPPPQIKYHFVYDRAVFHIFDEGSDRRLFAKHIYNRLVPDGIWHSLIGSTDGPPRDSGPPRRSAAEVVTAVEPFFEILELTSTHFDGDLHQNARAFVMVARRREPPLP